VEQFVLGLIHLATLIAIVFSLAIPLYCIPTALVAFFNQSPYSPWPPLVLTLLWVAQWPLIFLLVVSLPNAPAISGDSHDSVGVDSGLLLGFCSRQCGPSLLGLPAQSPVRTRRIAVNLPEICRDSRVAAVSIKTHP
jgi:hypothetical protein